MSDTLSDQLDGVMPNSPIGNEDDEHQNDELNEETEEEVDETKAEGTEEEGEGKDGRDLDNIHREFSRKQEKFQREMQEQFRETVQELTSALRETKPATPEQQGGNSLDSMPIEKLKNMRAQVPDEQKDAFNDYLMERIVSEEVGKRTTQLTENQSFELKRAQANQRAVDRYHELQDRTSEFRQAVETELRSRGGKAYAKANPSAVLDVANEVAADMGIRANVSSVRTVRRTPAQPNASKRGKPVQGPSADTITDEKAKAIADRLEAATGVKFDLKKIKETHKVYKDNQDLFVK